MGYWSNQDQVPAFQNDQYGNPYTNYYDENPSNYPNYSWESNNVMYYPTQQPAYPPPDFPEPYFMSSQQYYPSYPQNTHTDDMSEIKAILKAQQAQLAQIAAAHLAMQEKINAMRLQRDTDFENLEMSQDDNVDVSVEENEVDVNSNAETDKNEPMGQWSNSADRPAPAADQILTDKHPVCELIIPADRLELQPTGSCLIPLLSPENAKNAENSKSSGLSRETEKPIIIQPPFLNIQHKAKIENEFDDDSHISVVDTSEALFHNRELNIDHAVKINAILQKMHRFEFGLGELVAATRMDSDLAHDVVVVEEDFNPRKEADTTTNMRYNEIDFIIPPFNVPPLFSEFARLFHAEVSLKNLGGGGVNRCFNYFVVNLTLRP